MTLNDMLKNPGEWLKGTGPDADIVLSSRIRLARNIKKFPFTNWANKKQIEEIINTVKLVFSKNNYLKQSLFLELDKISDIDKQFLIERHIISKEHIINPVGRGVAVCDKEIISIMVNEEDHLRIQSINSGFNLSQAWNIISKLDTQLGQILNYAFNDEFGYLTACPTNIGTGMRASVMVHLPALVMSKKISKILNAIAKLNVAVRGLYGEGTQASGNLFQISNQITLGLDEEEIISNIEGIIMQVINHEKNARDNLMANKKTLVEDKIYRAYGTLKNARIITSNETIDLLSTLRLGVDLNIIEDIDRKMINELFILTLPAHLQKFKGKSLSPAQRDVFRSELIRKRLGI